MDIQVIQSKIYEIRGFRVMLDSDLAVLYQVETKALKQAVKRNIERFPSPDFMFELTKEEFDSLRSQIVTLKNSLEETDENISSKRGKHIKYLPYVFTQEGVASLSGILHSPIAIQVNISIMRAFVRLRELITGYTELNQKLEEFIVDTDMRFADVMDIINEMLKERKKDEKPRKRIGFIKEE